jgi:hypothetical protein
MGTKIKTAPSPKEYPGKATISASVTRTATTDHNTARLARQLLVEMWRQARVHRHRSMESRRLSWMDAECTELRKSVRTISKKLAVHHP